MYKLLCTFIFGFVISFYWGPGCWDLAFQLSGPVQRSSPSCQLWRESFTQNERRSFLLTSPFLYALLLGADIGKIALDLSTSIIRLLLCNFIILEIWFPEKAISLCFLSEINYSLRKDNFTSLWITFFFFWTVTCLISRECSVTN